MLIHWHFANFWTNTVSFFGYFGLIFLQLVILLEQTQMVLTEHFLMGSHLISSWDKADMCYMIQENSRKIHQRCDAAKWTGSLDVLFEASSYLMFSGCHNQGTFAVFSSVQFANYLKTLYTFKKKSRPQGKASRCRGRPTQVIVSTSSEKSCFHKMYTFIWHESFSSLSAKYQPQMTHKISAPVLCLLHSSRLE